MFFLQTVVTTKTAIALGARSWPRESQIVELFCGRGNGLRALHNLGFVNVEGIDLSPVLAGRYEGPGMILIGDCRHLPFADSSRDILIVQGGLHHLLELPHDLNQTLSEAVRVLRPDGRFVAVEPWLTPFLAFVHGVCRVPIARMVSPKLDALAAMIENEKATYDQWLGSPESVRGSLRQHFKVDVDRVGWGKLRFVGRKG